MLRALFRAGYPARRRRRHLDRRGQRRAGRRRPDRGGHRTAGPAVGLARGRRGLRRLDRPPGTPVRRPYPPALAVAAAQPARPPSSGRAATFEDLKVPFRCCAASIERAAEHWFDSGPLVDAVLASAVGAGAAAAGRDRRRALRRRRHRQLDPDRRGGPGRRQADLRAPGGADRAAADRAPTALGGRPGRVRDRPPAPVRPRAGGPARRCTGARAARPVAATAATTPRGRTATWPRWGAGSAAPTPPPGATWPRTSGSRPVVRDAVAAGLGPPAACIAPAVVVLAVVVLTTLPVWLLLARPRPRWCRAGCGCRGWSGSVVVYVLWDAAALVALAGLWVGLRLRLEDPHARVPARPLRADRLVPAGAVLAGPVGVAPGHRRGRHRPGHRRARPPGAGASAGTPGPATRSS